MSRAGHTTIVDESAANRLRQAAHAAVDHDDEVVECDVRDLFEVTAEAADGRRYKQQRDRYEAVLRRISTFSVKVGNCEDCRESANVADMFYELREIAGAALEEES